MAIDIEEIKIYWTTSIPSIPLSFMAIILNIFVINFYRKNELTVVPLLYTFIASADILSALAAVHQFTALFLYLHNTLGKKGLNDNAVVFYSVLQISYRCSVFFNLVLAVSRTVMIIRPFHRIRKFSVTLPCMLYPGPWIFLCGMNIHNSYGHYRTYYDDIRSKIFVIGHGFADSINLDSLSEPWLILTGLIEMTAFIVPVIVIIVTCIIQVITLQRSSQFPTSSNQRHVTITVLLMSTLFVICNSALSLYFTVIGAFLLSGNEDTYAYNKIEEQNNMITAMLATVLPILNAALNPVIIISRSSGMRRQFSELQPVRRIVSLLRGE